MKAKFAVAATLLVAISGNASARALADGIAKPPPSWMLVANAEKTPEALMGKDVFSQDQTLVGQVERVASTDGRVQAIYIRTGGFLGFGARLVSIPEDKFHMRGQNVQLQLTSEDVQKLPDVKSSS